MRCLPGVVALLWPQPCERCGREVLGELLLLLLCEVQEADKQRALKAKDDSQAMADVLGTAAKAASILAKKIIT